MVAPDLYCGRRKEPVKETRSPRAAVRVIAPLLYSGPEGQV
jgi:hypothetical protein